MAVGDSWTVYPWGNTSGDYSYGYSSSASMQYLPVWYANTGGQTYEYKWPVEQQIAEKIESAMDWLKRRVTEITDLAYSEI